MLGSFDCLHSYVRIIESLHFNPGSVWRKFHQFWISSLVQNISLTCPAAEGSWFRFLTTLSPGSPTRIMIGPRTSWLIFDDNRIGAQTLLLGGHLHLAASAPGPMPMLGANFSILLCSNLGLIDQSLKRWYSKVLKFQDSNILYHI